MKSMFAVVHCYIILVYAGIYCCVWCILVYCST